MRKINDSNSQPQLQDSKSSIANNSVSTPIFTNPSKCINDSAYCSFVSPRNSSIMNGSSSIPSPSTHPAIRPNNSGTSWSSRGSMHTNEEELEELFPNIDVQNPEFEIPHFRRSLRNSPWTCRPDSATLTEENEDDSDRETQFSISLTDVPVSATPGSVATVSVTSSISLTTTHHHHNHRRLSFTESDLRNEMIAIKLRAIADKLPQPAREASSSTLLNRHSSSFSDRRHSTTSTPQTGMRRNHSFSSSPFSEMLPPAWSSALDVMMSLYRVYQCRCSSSNNEHSAANATGFCAHNNNCEGASSFPKSATTTNFAAKPCSHLCPGAGTQQQQRRVNYRIRSHTE